jgi:hypothetical protein
LPPVLKNFVEQYFAFLVYSFIFVYWSVRRGFCVAVHLKGKDISVIFFLYFNSKVCKRLKKKLPMGEKSQKCKTIL